MALRRMFSTRVCNTARFLTMPKDARLLYFHLGLLADDDGVVEAFIVMRTCGCSEEDLKILQDKGFVKILNDEYVTQIVDWQENNRIRQDRKVDSIYKDLLTDDRQMPGKCQTNDGQMPDKCQTNDRQMPAQDRLGKVSIVKDSIERGRFTPPTPEEVRSFAQEAGLRIDADRFCDFYASKGWKVGKNPMKDWKAAARNWARRDDKKPQSYSSGFYTDDRIAEIERNLANR